VRYMTIVGGARRLSPAASPFHINVLILRCCKTGITIHGIHLVRLHFNCVETQ
jgi:hypothetical protein